MSAVKELLPRDLYLLEDTPASTQQLRFISTPEFLPENVLTLLRNLGLSAYHDPFSLRIWIGLEGDYAPHTRWFFASKPVISHENRLRGWHELEFFAVPACGQNFTHWFDQSTLQKKLQYLLRRVDEAFGSLGMNGLPLTSSQQMLVHFRESSILGDLDLVAFEPASLGSIGMHDLLFHHDAWLGRHPEAVTVPKDLLLRMHGLGPMLAHVMLNLNSSYKTGGLAGAIIRLVKPAQAVSTV